MESLINIQVYGEHDNMANRYAKMKDASNPFVVGDVVEMAPPRSTHGIVGTVERLVSDFGVQVAWNNGVITVCPCRSLHKAEVNKNE